MVMVFQAGHLILTVLPHHTDTVPHILLGEGFAASDKCQKAFHRAGSLVYGFRVIPGDLQFRVPHHQGHTKLFFDQPDILVKISKEGFRLAQPV